MKLKFLTTVEHGVPGSAPDRYRSAAMRPGMSIPSGTIVPAELIAWRVFRFTFGGHEVVIGLPDSVVEMIV